MALKKVDSSFIQSHLNTRSTSCISQSCIWCCGQLTLLFVQKVPASNLRQNYFQKNVAYTRHPRATAPTPLCLMLPEQQAKTFKLCWSCAERTADTIRQ